MKKYLSNKVLCLKISAGVISFLLLLGGALVYGYSKHAHTPQRQQTLPYVKLVEVTLKNNVQSIVALGKIRAQDGVVVKTAVSGVVNAIYARSDEEVDKGERLLSLQNDDLKAKVEQDKARVDLATFQLKTVSDLRPNGFVSEESMQEAKSQLAQEIAQLHYDQALLDKTIIKAPFSGKLGIIKVDLGQYIAEGDALVSLQNNHQLYVDFTVPQNKSHFLRLKENLSIIDTNNHELHCGGVISALDSMVNDDNYSLAVRGKLSMPCKAVTPGMYVNVSVSLPNAKSMPFIPQTAVIYNPFGNFVYVYNQGKAIQQYVTLGRRLGDGVFVKNGLRVGTKIISEGYQALYNGAKVQLTRAAA